MKEGLYLTQNMPSEENDCSWHSVKALETRRRIFAHVDVVLKERNLTVGRESSFDVAEEVAGGAGLTAPVSWPASLQDFPSLL